MRPVIITKHLTSPTVNAIAASQTLAAAGNLVLNGGSVVSGVAVLDTQRRVLITSAGNDAGVTFTLYGSNEAGAPIWEVVQGVSAAATASSLDFLNVGTIAVSGTIASTVTVGTNGTGSTPWKNPSWNLTPFELEVDSSVISGAGTYNVEYTLDDYYSPQPPTVATPIPRVRAAVVSGATGDSQFQFGVPGVGPVRGWRTTITNGTGTVQTEAIQAGIVNF